MLIMPLRLRTLPKIVLALLALAIASATMAPPALAQTPVSKTAKTTKPSDPASGFPNWVAAFKVQAWRAGIPKPLLETAFKTVKYNARVIELDNYQPEFVQPLWVYLRARTKPQTIKTGRALMRKHAKLFTRVKAKYGVDSAYIASIWRLESNYGQNMGSFNVIEALATLAYAGRRKNFWRQELLSALRIVKGGHAPLSRLVGSWAGAVGHTQFIPSSYLLRAVDFDGNGKKDLWTSLPDVFASTGNYLKQAGWKPGMPFGIEVRVPKKFDYTLANIRVRRTAAQWRALGVRRINGKALPGWKGGLSIVVPAGYRGPKFLVNGNYRASLRYNNAEAYALTIGLLAEKLRGRGRVRTAWPVNDPPLSFSQKEELQTHLNALGFNVGTVDGKVGPDTRKAIRAFQRSVKAPPDGYASLKLLSLIRKKAGRK